MRIFFWKNLSIVIATVIAIVAGVLVSPGTGNAIPAFARKYQTSCTTCHTDFPKLNDFGKAFKDAGFQFPKDDESFIKEPPVMLGAPAQKQNFPHTVWPGSIPGLPPIGLRMNNFFQVVGRNRGNFDAVAAPGTLPTFIPRTDFETGLFSIFTAGNFGSGIAFWVDDDISVAGQNANGGLGDGYLKFVNLGRLFKLPKDSFSLRAGQFELDLPFTQARSINLSPYDIYQQANIGAMNSMFALQQNVNSTFAFAGAGKGVEISGGHTYGGYHYSLAVIDQNTSGADQGSTTTPYVPSATGSAGGGVGFASDANFKDIYGRFSYRINLERDPASRNEIQAAGKTGPRDHTYLNLGGFYFYGRSLQRFLSETTIVVAHEPFYRAGGDFSFNFRALNIYGLFMRGRDNNLLPVDSSGNLIVLPLTETSTLPSGFIRGVPATFSGGFVQADYLVLPWIMGIMRYDSVNSTADRINGVLFNASTPYFAPFNSTRNRFTPGVQFLIRPNIKLSFEYQIRPVQSVTIGQYPDGTFAAFKPFRTNTATAGLEFVY